MSANAPGSADSENVPGPVTMSRLEPGIGVICLYRPARLNALNLEIEGRVTCRRQKEGMAAFLAKRRPVFKGR